jgi:hypothetical protein
MIIEIKEKLNASKKRHKARPIIGAVSSGKKLTLRCFMKSTQAPTEKNWFALAVLNARNVGSEPGSAHGRQKWNGRNASILWDRTLSGDRLLGEMVIILTFSDAYEKQG